MAEFVRCILPAWKFRITGRLTRSSVCWMRWRPTTGTRPALRRSSCGAPACGFPRSLNSNGGISTTQVVRKSKSRRARTVRLHPDLVQLFTNWPANRSPRDKVVSLSMRRALRHIGDGIEWAGLDEETPGTGKRRAGAHSLRHSAARHWLVAGRVPLNVVSQWLGHTNMQVTLRIYLPIVGSDYGMDAVP